MDSTMWIVAVILCLVVNKVFSDDNCSTYGSVQQQNEICRRNHLTLFNRGMVNSSQVLSSLQTDCSNANLYYTCMDNFVRGCDNEDAIRTEARNSMNACNGSDVADWVKDFVPSFDGFNRSCWSRHPFAASCSDADGIFYRLYPFSNITESVEDGLRALKGLKSELMRCQLQGLRSYSPEECSGGSVRDTYITDMVTMFGLDQDRPLGVYLNDTDIQKIKNLVLGSAEEPGDEIEISH